MIQFPRDITKVLSEAELSQIRGGYSAMYMNASATKSIAGPYPPAWNFVQPLLSRYFTEPYSIPETEREECIIGILGARYPGGLVLGIHLYWGLAVGLSADRVANVLLLASAYTGEPVFASAIVSMQIVVNTLNRLCADANGEPISSKDATAAIAAAWNNSLTAMA